MNFISIYILFYTKLMFVIKIWKLCLVLSQHLKIHFGKILVLNSNFFLSLKTLIRRLDTCSRTFSHVAIRGRDKHGHPPPPFSSNQAPTRWDPNTFKCWSLTSNVICQLADCRLSPSKVLLESATSLVVGDFVVTTKILYSSVKGLISSHAPLNRRASWRGDMSRIVKPS